MRSLLVSMAMAAVSTAGAQTWDPVGTTELLTTHQVDATGTAAILVAKGEMWYTDFDGLFSPPPEKIGTATTAYCFPVKWHDDETTEFYATDPANSPTGSSIKITLTVDAVAYEMKSTAYNGYVVGILRTYEWTSGTASGELAIFDPGAMESLKADAKASVKSLATGETKPAPSGTGGDPDCMAACKSAYELAKNNAKDTWLTRTKTYCGIVGVPGSFATGCGIGVAICGWILPPASTAACCIAGGIIGTGAGVGGCAYAFHEEYQLELRNAERAYKACMEACGVIFAEV